MARIIDLKGKIFGELFVVQKDENVKKVSAYWKCKCSCGKEKSVRSDHLIQGRVISCGCVGKERLKLVITHHLRGSRQYLTYRNMVNRCKNPNVKEYKHYGGRGIRVCDGWSTFEGFWSDMEKGYSDNLTLERLDVNGDYCKDNCCWATTEVQSKNKRNTLKITYDGETKTLADWSRELNIDYFKLRTMFNKNSNVLDTIKNKTP